MGFAALLRILGMRWPIVLVASLCGLAASFFAAALLPPKYDATSRVLVDSIQRNTLTGLVEPRVRVAEFLGQQAAIASSRTVAIEVLDRLESDGILVVDDLRDEWTKQTGGILLGGNDLRLWAADRLLANLSVEANSLESTLSLTYRADQPTLAAQVANAFASSYMATVQEQKQLRYFKNARGFSDETSLLAEDVSSARRDLADFRERSGILPIGAQEIEGAELELAALTARLAEARADNSEAQSLYQQVTQTQSEDLIHFPVPEDALAARQAQMRLGAVATQLARLSERFGPTYPDYVEAVQEMRRLEETIRAAVRDRADYAAERLDALQRDSDAMKAGVSEIQARRDDYNLLQDRVNASKETFNLVATRSLEEALQARLNSTEVFLLGRAIPNADSATPPASIIIALGLCLGLIVGTSLAAIAEFADDRVREEAAVRRVLRAPVFGELGISKKRISGRELLTNGGVAA